MRKFLEEFDNRVGAGFLYTLAGVILILIQSYLNGMYVDGVAYRVNETAAVLQIMKHPVFWAVAVGSFLFAQAFQFFLYRVLLEENLGWMRLALTLGGLGALAGAVYIPLFDEYFDVWGVLGGLYVIAPLGAFIMATPIVIGRWVARGFKSVKDD